MVLMGAFRDEIIFVAQIIPVLSKVKLIMVLINEDAYSYYRKSIFQKVGLNTEILVVL